jgi:thioesterase domain-containing protein
LPQTLLDLASRYAEALLALTIPEPVHLVGWSMGGVLGIELAHALERLAMPPASLTLIDVFVCAAPGEIELTAAQKVAGFFADYLQDAAALRTSQAQSLTEAVTWLRLAGRLRENETTEALEPLYLQYAQLAKLLISHRVSSLPNCPTELIAAVDQPADGFAALTPLHAYRHALDEGVRITRLPGDHYTIVSRARAAAIAARILELIASDSVQPVTAACEPRAAGSISGARS